VEEQGQILCLNLISEHKSMESKLLGRYAEMVEEVDLDENELAYAHFDFHDKCRGQSDPMMEEIEKNLFK